MFSAQLPPSLTNNRCERRGMISDTNGPILRIVPEATDTTSVPPKTQTLTITHMGNQHKLTKFDGNDPNNNNEVLVNHCQYLYSNLKTLGYKVLHDEAGILLEKLTHDWNKLSPKERAENKKKKDSIPAKMKGLKNKQQALVQKSFDLCSDLLMGDAKDEFDKAVSKVCDSDPYIGKDGVEVTGSKWGKNWDSLAYSIREWLLTKLPEDSADRQYRYVTNQIHLPLYNPTKDDKSMIRPWIARIRKIVELMPYLPCLKDVEGAPNDLPRRNLVPKDLELCQIILNTMPIAIQDMYRNRTENRFEDDVEELTKHLIAIEPEYIRNQELQSSIRTNGKGKDKPSDKKSGTKRKTMAEDDPIPKKTRKLCQLCATASPSTKNSHNTKDCRKFFLGPDGTPIPKGKKGKFKNTNAHHQQQDDMMQMFMTTLKKQGKAIKKLSKQADLDDSSDSDSN